VYGLAAIAYFLLSLVMIGMGARVWDGTPQVIIKLTIIHTSLKFLTVNEF